MNHTAAKNTCFLTQQLVESACRSAEHGEYAKLVAGRLLTYFLQKVTRFTMCKFVVQLMNHQLRLLSTYR